MLSPAPARWEQTQVDNPGVAGVQASVVALIATYRRPRELSRLLECLARSGRTLQSIVVADNASEEEVRRLVVDRQSTMAGVELLYLPMPENKGCGAGLRAAEEEALVRYPGASHFWILDDDAVPPGNALDRLIQALVESRADLVAPLLADAGGDLWAFPEPCEKNKRKTIRRCRLPSEAMELLGQGPHPFCWCTGACMLVTRQAVMNMGLHRDDFWMLGEDIEFSMRVASRGKAVFICDVVVPHLPPVAVKGSDKMHLKKFLALLQNLSYLSFHQTCGFHMRSYLPGNYRRFFKTFGLSFRTLFWAWKAFRGGTVCGEPAGGRSGQGLRRAVEKTAVI